MRACIASHCFHGNGGAQVEKLVVVEGGGEDRWVIEWKASILDVISVNAESPRGVLSE